MICMENSEYDIMKLDDESSDDSLLVMQVPAQDENQVQVLGDVNGQVENQVQVEENVNVNGQVENQVQENGNGHVENQVQVEENVNVNGHVENQVQFEENVNVNGQVENHVQVNGIGQVENQVQVEENENVNGLAIQIFEEHGTKDSTSTRGRQCRAYTEAKGKRCARMAIRNDIYCCAHFSSKKGKRVEVHIPMCGGITIYGNSCKHRSLPGRAFCKKHLRNVKKGQTSSSRSRTQKRKFEENCTDVVLVHPETPLEINPVSVINRDDSFTARNIIGETLMLSGADSNEIKALQWIGSPHHGNDHSEDSCFNNENGFKCKICFEEFSDNQTLGKHWMEYHEKEALWLFRSYACAICLNSFKDKKLMETHVQERHRVQFFENSVLLICNPCGREFQTMDELWLHVMSSHHAELKLSKAPEKLTLSTGNDSLQMIEYGNEVQVQDNENVNDNGQVENQVQVQEQEIGDVNGLAIQIFEEPGTRDSNTTTTTDRQCRAYIEAKRRQCARTAIINDIYCCAHFSSKKRKFVDVRTPISQVPSQVENQVQVQEETSLTTNQYFHGEPSRSNDKKELASSFYEWLEVDEPVAVWFKHECGDKWHAGIKCARADWPLSIIRGKPTNDNENKSFVIFSLEAKKYFWVDMLLVQSIHEFPQPIAYETHQDGLEFVQDLTTARQFIMQKLAGDMLHMIHLIHFNAMIESAQHVIVWKQFGMEAYKCHTYSELGRMVKKLQNNIVQQYIKANWKLHSYESWAERCMDANSAETIELLQEELYGSICWKDIRALSNAPMQPKLDSEWETWKYDVMKCFTTFSNNGTQHQHASSSDGFRQVSSENHTKEAQWIFRGYSCALCFNSFNKKKLLETHVQERHRVKFQDHLLLLLCIPCGRHFVNAEELRLHFMSAHPAGF